ncbi:12011_t:CDS:2 [Entrophospora sp. SA101]|nr:3146_t:CDS:2 [Entrophospora sp. SA101]CAJ0753412.1 12011_t:CDS:2 [Entrophospora sp. SA101]
MPHPSDCKQQVTTRHQNKNGCFSELQEQQLELIENDDDIEKRLELVWKKDALKNKRVYYNSTSRTTQ